MGAAPTAARIIAAAPTDGYGSGYSDGTGDGA